ncbi:MAG: trigger factor [Alphaproteobacteria bacterium]|nr:trigger factor [Alphaproteobacteria bacterium]
MKILNSTIDGLKRSYTVFVSPDEVENAFVEKLKERAAQTRMSGFRPGKVPVDVIRRMYGVTMRADSVKNLIAEISRKIINDEKLSVSFDFATKILKDDSNGIEFSLTFETMPAVDVKDLSSVELTKHVAEITKTEINSIFDEIRKNNKNWVDEPAKTKAKEGHKVSVDLLAKIKMKNRKNDIANNIDIIIGDPNVMDAFWKPLIDKKVGDVVEFSVNYPKDLKDKNLAGKKLDYSATIKKIAKATEFELDDTFAKSLGYEDFSKLHAWAETRAISHYDQMSKGIMKRDLLEKMADLYDFSIPKNMLDVELGEVKRQLTIEAKKLGHEMTPEAEAECVKIAESRVRLGFVVAEIAKKHKITVSKEEISASIRNIATMYPGHEKAIWDMYSRGAALNAVVGPILEEKVVNFLFGIIKIKEKKCSVKQLIELDEETFDFFKENNNEASHDSKKKKKVEKKETENVAEKAEKKTTKSKAEKVVKGAKAGKEEAEPKKTVKKNKKEAK